MSESAYTSPIPQRWFLFGACHKGQHGGCSQVFETKHGLRVYCSCDCHTDDYVTHLETREAR